MREEEVKKFVIPPTDKRNVKKRPREGSMQEHVSLAPDREINRSFRCLGFT